MKKYRVLGNTVVSVFKEVYANSEEEAYEIANQELHYLTGYVGNNGYDKLVGVIGDDESVSADDTIEWDDIEFLEDDPDYFECPDCREECERRTDVDGTDYWFCEECCTSYDDGGDIIYPEAEELDFSEYEDE